MNMNLSVLSQFTKAIIFSNAKLLSEKNVLSGYSWVKFIVLFLFGTLLLACSHASLQSAKDIGSSKPKNILWVYIEDQNAWNNAYGDFTVSTPTIKQFAQKGVRFEQAIMPAPVCSATRSALITGVHQAKIGIHNHRSSRSNYAAIFLPKGYKSIPELFRESGYATFNIGKDDYNFKYDRSALYSEHAGPVAGHQGAMKGAAFDWAKELKDKPFFGQIQLSGGKHNPKSFNGIALDKVLPEQIQLPPYYPDTPSFRQEYVRHYQTQQISDFELRDILAQLEKYDLLSNTAIFWFSDHGMGLLRHKQEMYEESVRVPLVINWPAGNEQLRQLGSVRKELISGLDITATTLALAGIDIPDYYDGENLFSPGYNGRQFVISAKDRMDHTFDRSRTVRTEKFRYIRNFMPERSRMQPQYRDKKNFSIEFRSLLELEPDKLTPEQKFYTLSVKPVEELYDLQKDPHQVVNLADKKAYRGELLRHRKILLNWIADIDDKGAYPESDAAVREVIDMWGEKCVSPECQSYRKRYADTLHLPANRIHPEVKWPSHMKKPEKKIYEIIESI